MRTKIFKSIILFVFFILSACQDHNSQIANELIKPPTTTPATLEITSTVSTPTAIIVPFYTPSPSPYLMPRPYGVQKDCFSSAPSFQQNADSTSNSILILSQQAHYSYLDLDTKNLSEISKLMGFFDLQVSPDRQKIAYHDFQAKQIVVMTAGEKVLQNIPWSEGWYAMPRWQNNDELLVVTREHLQSTAPNPPSVLIALNTVTSKTQKLYPEYPDIAQAYTLPWQSGHTVYDPTLTRVVYAKSTFERQDYVLWDIEGKRALVSLGADTRVEPVWSPDSSAFIVFTLNGLTLVGKDGIIQKTIDINNMVPATFDKTYSARNFSWSPDGNRVAFWLVRRSQTGNDENYTLVYWDISSGNLIDTCIDQGEELLGWGNFKPRLVWSPSGDQIAVYANYREIQKTWDVIIADVEQKSAVKIAENLYPVGWMMKAP